MFHFTFNTEESLMLYYILIVLIVGVNSLENHQTKVKFSGKTCYYLIDFRFITSTKQFEEKRTSKLIRE